VSTPGTAAAEGNPGATPSLALGGPPQPEEAGGMAGTMDKVKGWIKNRFSRSNDRFNFFLNRLTVWCVQFVNKLLFFRFAEW
jgi:hypothetical protein